MDESDLVRRLRGDDAQTFIDVIDEVYSSPLTRHHEIRLIEDTSYRLGAGQPQLFDSDTKERS